MGHQNNKINVTTGCSEHHALDPFVLMKKSHRIPKVTAHDDNNETVYIYVYGRQDTRIPEKKRIHMRPKTMCTRLTRTKEDFDIDTLSKVDLDINKEVQPSASQSDTLYAITVIPFSMCSGVNVILYHIIISEILSTLQNL